MVTEIVPWLLGPAGIVLGWWLNLNQHTLVGNAEREAIRADDADERQRVLDTVTLGRDAAGLIRSLLHGIYLKSPHGNAPKGLDEMMNDFNRSKDAFRSSILTLRCLGHRGPSKVRRGWKSKSRGSPNWRSSCKTV